VHGYQPIEDYGIIGNMYTVALVAKTGSIDGSASLFDSPSVFGGIWMRGSAVFRINPAGGNTPASNCTGRILTF